MAIGNQLDLNIVVNGFNQAQSALDRLSGVFGNLGQNAVNVSSTFKNLQLSLERSQSEITGVSNTTNKATKSISDFGESLTAVEGGGNRAGESIRDIAQIVQQAEQDEQSYQAVQELRRSKALEEKNKRQAARFNQSTKERDTNLNEVDKGEFSLNYPTGNPYAGDHYKFPLNETDGK